MKLVPCVLLVGLNSLTNKQQGFGLHGCATRPIDNAIPLPASPDLSGN
jgi:hypothetical protein